VKRNYICKKAGEILPFLFLYNFKVVCIFWRNAANYLLFLKETCLTRKKEEKGDVLIWKYS